MGFYVLIHWVSLGLAAATLCILLAAVARQGWRHRRAQTDARRRESLMTLALEYIEEPQFLPAFTAQLQPADQRLLVELFAGLLPKVRGDYAEKIVQLMRANFDRLIGAAADAAALTVNAGDDAGRPTLAVAISCIGRRLVLGERVEDVFFITTKAGEPLTDPARQQQLRKRLIDVLSV